MAWQGLILFRQMEQSSCSRPVVSFCRFFIRFKASLLNALAFSFQDLLSSIFILTHLYISSVPPRKSIPSCMMSPSCRRWSLEVVDADDKRWWFRNVPLEDLTSFKNQLPWSSTLKQPWVRDITLDLNTTGWY